jgi:hypothetical protein
MTAITELSSPSIQDNALPMTAMPALGDSSQVRQVLARPRKQQGKRARKISAAGSLSGGVLREFPVDTD